ncbi:MAG: PilZ domain-containing protein [Bradyrhizobium sp.]|uniref:PilZ domain-containing protein n=1 Tax=Bradyrhizobium sp. TaxID=376 RepID=UPI001DE1B163|nr:PilZ domain-containing protein [Bradyrhizobium sp.]MBV9560942.1 PilZ domain-containing protein [Bradyrhizobium sp.]
MLPLATQIRLELPSTERRRKPRHPLALEVSGPTRAIIENISETGLALRTSAVLLLGETVELELPIAGTVTARVAWAEDELFGCEFADPIGKGAVSAARLRSPFDAPAATAHEVLVWTRAEPHAHYGVAMGVMLAFLLVAAMFVAAMMTAPIAIS